MCRAMRDRRRRVERRWPGIAISDARRLISGGLMGGAAWIAVVVSRVVGVPELVTATAIASTFHHVARARSAIRRSGPSVAGDRTLGG